MHSHADHTVVILGAGMSGICAAIQLQKAGIDDFVIIEKQLGIGGTWWATRYPGAQVDVPSPVYAFSFAPNPDWTQRFADASEIQCYVQRLADAHGLSDKIRLATRLHEARWDASSARWQFQTDQGDTLSARFFVCSTGPLSQPRWPEIPGLDTFAGVRVHSANWHSEGELRGLRVGVIGTASSAVQLIPPIAKQATQLYVFQRSANWVLPRLSRRYRWFDRLLMRVPGYAHLVRAGWAAMLERVRGGFEATSLMRRVMLVLSGWQRRRQLPDQRMRVSQTPTYPLGCKRMIFSNDYYPALARANVELVTANIQRISERGLVTDDGREHLIDALVCATGFDTVNLLSSLTIIGRDGDSLHDAWRGEPQAFHGITVAGFPNMFLLLGPNTATGHTSTLLFIEPAVAHVIDCMRWVLESDSRSLEVREEISAAHNADLQQRLDGSVWSQCRSWYRSNSGRIVALFPGYTREYRRGVRRIPRSAYRID